MSTANPPAGAEVQAPATHNPASRRGPKPQPANRRRCAATTKAGAPCPTLPMSGRDRCRMHAAQSDPALAAQVALERKIGGHLAQRPVADVHPDFGSEAAILATLNSAAAAVVAGQLSPSVLNSLSQAAGIAIRLIEVRQDAEELRLTHEEAQAKKKVVVITQTPSGAMRSEGNAK